MSTDSEDVDPIAAVLDVVTTTSLPAPVQTAFFKAMGRLVGGAISYPAAWLRRPAQAVEDTTDAKTLIMKRLAEKVAEKAASDPEIVENALQMWLPEQLRKSENKGKIAERVSERIETDLNNSGTRASSSDPSSPSKEPLDDDWLNAFIRYAEDASSERMQALWAGVMSGEIVRPGSFSRQTLRFLSELEQETTEDFRKVQSNIIGNAIFIDEPWFRGALFEVSSRLESVGVLSGNAGSTGREYRFLDQGYAILPGDRFGLVLYAAPGSDHNFSILPLTRIGKDLARLLPGTNEVDNMIAFTKRLSATPITSVRMGELVHNDNNSMTVINPHEIWRKS